MAKASASHILVSDEKLANDIKEKLSNGASFSSMATQYSECPSSAEGGSLGVFSKGMMVKEFDDVVFDVENTKIGDVVGPVATEFGYHLIKVTMRL